MACENCLYRKNCQFLSKHKNVEVKDCTAFMNETEFIKKAKTEAIREVLQMLKEVVYFSELEVLIEVLEEMTEEAEK